MLFRSGKIHDLSGLAARIIKTKFSLETDSRRSMHTLEQRLILDPSGECSSKQDAGVPLGDGGGFRKSFLNRTGPRPRQFGAELGGVDGDVGLDHAPTLVQVAVQNFPWAMLLVSTGSPYSS